MIAAEHVASRGRKRIAVLAGTKRSPISSSFLSGVRAGLATRSITILEGYSAYGEYDVKTSEEIAAQWFTGRHIPDAVLVIDEQMVPPIYRAVRQRGLRVGQDVSIISRGSAGYAESLEPKLSTIEISGHQIGEMAGQILLKALSKTPPPRQRIMLSSRLILNASA
jgi:DNA-binding LacI/PurR family transcriptional regulator